MVKRVVIVIAVPLLAAVVYVTGAYRYATPSALRELLLGLGLLGPVVFMGAFALGATLWVPSTVFIFGAALTWPPAAAVLISWVGAIIAGLPAFLLARYAARDWVQGHLGNRFHRVDAALARGGVRGVILLRLVLFLQPGLPPALALTHVRLYQFVLGSAIGLLPGTVMWVLLGGKLVEWGRRQPPIVWAGIAIGVVCIVAAVLTVRRRRASAQARATLTPAPDPAQA